MSCKSPLLIVITVDEINAAVNRFVNIKVTSLPLSIVLASTLTNKLSIEVPTGLKSTLEYSDVIISNCLQLCACYGIVVLHDTHGIKKLIRSRQDILCPSLISL